MPKESKAPRPGFTFSYWRHAPGYYSGPPTNLILSRLDMEHASLSDVLDGFASFLRACGYQIPDGGIDVVEDEETGPLMKESFLAQQRVPETAPDPIPEELYCPPPYTVPLPPSLTPQPELPGLHPPLHVEHPVQQFNVCGEQSEHRV